MKKWRQGMMAAALLTGAVLSGGPHAVVDGAQAKEGTVVSSLVPEQESHDQGGHHKFRQRISAHQRMYMTLLAEKYTPESLGEWQTVLKERDRLIAEMKAAREAAGQDRAWLAKREERKQVKEQLRAKVEKGEITPEQMKQQWQEWKEKHFPGKTGEEEERRAQMEKFRAVHEEFDAAIESDDQAKIKAVLPKLLEQLKAKNQRLAKKLEEVKK